ncbi:MAG: hypothetical protein Q9165_000978 [Trypethelium subeluteriae]
MEREAMPWWRGSIGSRLKPEMAKMLRDYSDISDDEIEEHILAVRERAWQVRPFPCLGQFGFLLLRSPTLPTWPQIESRVKEGATILDLGCCFGQDLRYLAASGAPTEKMYASDLFGEFWEISYDFFRDRSRMKARFFQADAFEATSSLKDLNGQIDIVLATQFFHLFDWDKQVELGVRILELTRPGAIIVGYQIGSLFAAEVATTEDGKKGSPENKRKYYHNSWSWKILWREVEKKSGIKCTVQASLKSLSAWHSEKEDYDWMGFLARGLEFSVVRE